MQPDQEQATRVTAEVIDFEQFRRRAGRDRRPLLELADGRRPMLRSPFRALSTREVAHRARMLDHMKSK